MKLCQVTGKHAHAEKYRAERQRASMLKRIGYRGEVYKCPHCGGWHVGTNPQSRDRRKRK